MRSAWLVNGCRIYQQTFIDTYTKVAAAKLYDRKNALIAADMLKDRVLPFFEEQGITLLRILTDRATEYCGARENHEYGLYLLLMNYNPILICRWTNTVISAHTPVNFAMEELQCKHFWKPYL